MRNHFGQSSQGDLKSQLPLPHMKTPLPHLSPPLKLGRGLLGVDLNIADYLSNAKYCYNPSKTQNIIVKKNIRTINHKIFFIRIVFFYRIS